MTSAGSTLSVSAFATADSGSEYLATAEHYGYLAKAIVDALHRGCLVLVTGDPPANPPMLAAALRKASAPPNGCAQSRSGPHGSSITGRDRGGCRLLGSVLSNLSLHRCRSTVR